MATEKWVLEPTHSEVTFKVRHMMISHVSGLFRKFESTVETEGDDLSTAKVHFTASVDSITTQNEQRDAHLKSTDFFDATNHPQIEFESSGMEKVNDDKYKLHGELTMRGVTKPVTLNVEYGGAIKDPYGMIRSGFSLDGKINRRDYGLNWSALTEAGGMVAGDDVKIQAHVEFVKK